MNDSDLTREVCRRMIQFDQGDAKRIQHFLKVHAFAQLIAQGERLDPRTRRIAECAALVHDIGIHPAEAKYGCSDGKLQEQEGPAPARTLLTAAGLAPADIDRICWLVGHHHTYAPVDGLDHQILIEADFLVNFYEDGIGEAAIRHAYDHIFRTATGRALCRAVYGLC